MLCVVKGYSINPRHSGRSERCVLGSVCGRTIPSALTLPSVEAYLLRSVSEHGVKVKSSRARPHVHALAGELGRKRPTRPLARGHHQRGLSLQPEIHPPTSLPGSTQLHRTPQRLRPASRVAHLPHCVSIALAWCCNFRQRLYCVRILTADTADAG